MISSGKEKTLKQIKHDYLKVAEELYYGDEALERIRQANDENEIIHIMTTFRKRMVEKELYTGRRKDVKKDGKNLRKKCSIY